VGDAWLFKQRMLKPELGRGGAMGSGIGEGLVGMDGGRMDQGQQTLLGGATEVQFFFELLERLHPCCVCDTPDRVL